MIVAVIAQGARADDWSGGVEAGGEADSNVRRVEVGPTTTEAPIAAGLFRLGGRVAGRGDTRYGSWTVDGLGLLRAVATQMSTGESVGVVAGDARWDVAIPHRTARAFVRADVYDVLGLEGLLSTRAFATRGAEAGVALADGERRVTVTGGARDFTYKPDHDFDWRGPSFGVRLDAPLWRATGDEPAALELSADYRFERRSFSGLAFANGCTPGAAPDPMCYVPTTAHRADLHHRALAQLTYTGERVLSAGYELVVADSTSYGQSVIRHRVLASATSELGARVLITASAILELDQYPAPLLVARDVNSTSFSSIEDDNRNMISVLLGRPITGRWSVEARWALWANAFTGDAYSFRRQVVYVGIVWGAPH
ncbi:MAG TPA: hypothetical protein VL463_17895 [Kofleriaceae bacterium]|nr:hypothetical protein [Kofleriaceae bacterium]